MHYPLVIILIAIALIFEFSNGFHDTANAVATSIATKSLEPFQAISVSAVFNLIGSFSGTAVASTIVSGLAYPHLATHIVIFVALLSAIGWNIITWYFEIPSSSSHALIGSLVGAIGFRYGFHMIHIATVIDRVVLPMVISPVLTFILAIFIVTLMHKLFCKRHNIRKINHYIRESQVISTACLSFSQGANDAQKSMGIITLVLFNAGIILTTHIPYWVIILCAVSISSGTLCGGMRIIRTLSDRVAKLKPANGFSSEISSAIVLFLGACFGIPLSTTHAVSGAIMGSGSVGHGKIGINLGIVKRIVTTWVLTLPMCILMSGGLLHIVMWITRLYNPFN